MANILADVEKRLDTADATRETVEPQQKRSRKPLLLVPVIPLIAAAIAGGIVFIKRRASKKSEW
ncbi:MAG TPA: hypothetical protein VKT25_00395 [Ktedonobacteraceae bacterium]|nr:hypothetical protein [Ktedonobacteraceae bacterium]